MSTSPYRKLKNYTVIHHTNVYITLQEAQELHSDSPHTCLHHPTGSSRTTQWFTTHMSTSPYRKLKNNTVIHHTQIHIILPEVQELHSDSSYTDLHHLVRSSRTTQWFTTQIYITLSEVQELHSDSPYTDLHHPVGSSRTTQWFTIHRSTSPSRKFKNYTVIQHTQIYITIPEVQELHSDSTYTDLHHHPGSSRTAQWFTIHRSTSPCQKLNTNTVILRTHIHITLQEAQELHSDSPHTDPDHPAGISRTTQWFTIHRSTSPCQKFKNNIVILHTQIYITLQEAQELHSDSPYTDPHHPAGSSRTTQWFSIHRSRSLCWNFKNYTVIHHTQIHITLQEVQELHSDSPYTDPHHPAGSSRTTQWFSIHRSTSPCRKCKSYTVIQHTHVYITLPEIQEIMVIYWKLFKTKQNFGFFRQGAHEPDSLHQQTTRTPYVGYAWRSRFGSHSPITNLKLLIHTYKIRSY